ncbi:MAG TPA: tetratricopeptide repeat protein [Streptosporangiaceae bacterium]|nr:tetratricopeptide repeat protein [Streptosporangiaceae bacterium]
MAKHIRKSVTSPARSQAAWPVWVGDPPPLAAPFVAREGIGHGVVGLPPGGMVVLTEADAAPGQSHPGLGGTGKTQLAVSCARSAWRSKDLDLVTWVPARSQDSILTGYAQAASAIHICDPADDADSAAAGFLGWLDGTSRPWLVVLDDLRDPADLAGLRPRGQAGRVVVTTRLPAESLAGQGCTVVRVGAFSERDALNYLITSLREDPGQRTGALDLAGELGCLPVALALAVALMNNRGQSCREYQADLARSRQMADTHGDGRLATVSAACLLAVGRAGELCTTALAWYMLSLVAPLDEGGIPAAVLTTMAASEYLRAAASAAPTADGWVADVLRDLSRVGLLTMDTHSTAQTVRMHRLVKEAIRQFIPPAALEAAAMTAASALLEAWPDSGCPPELGQAMRACALALRPPASGLLWSPAVYPLLRRVGHSLDEARLVSPAARYWRELWEDSVRTLGEDDARTLHACDRLGPALQAAGQTGEAVSVCRQALSAWQQKLGSVDPATLAALSRLAEACLADGRHAEAVSLYEDSLAACGSALGPGHPDTLASRTALAAALRAAGRPEDAVTAYRRAVQACESSLGAGNEQTLAAMAGLASVLQATGRLGEAVPLRERILREHERALGEAHPDTLAARAALASACCAAGKTKQGIAVYTKTLAGLERVLGHDHPDTLATRGNLAAACHTAGRFPEAIALYEQTLAGRERTLGPDHRETVVARGNLASAYHSAGRMLLAIPLYEQTVSDCERVAGPSHPDTLTARANLASAYHTVGRLTDAVAGLERTLADCERELAPGHPLTVAISDNLKVLSA